MDGENQSKTVDTPTPASEPNLSPPSQHPPPPISSSVRRPPRRGGRVPQAVVMDAEEVNKADIYDVSQPSRGKKRTSWVWHEYELEGEGTKDDKARCMHCKQRLSAKSSHGTKHLSDHLLKFCVMKKLQGNRQQTLRFNTKKSGEKRLENYDFNQAMLRQDLVDMIVMHEYPLTIVDHLGFRRFVSGLNPDFAMIISPHIKD